MDFETLPEDLINATVAIEDETFLQMLDKRWYYDETGHLKLLNAKTDSHLIGKRLGFRSPCTCNSKEGVCELCYGTLFDINDDLFSQGSLAAKQCSIMARKIVAA